MSEKKYTIIANWKMRLSSKESVFLFKQYKKLKLKKNIELVITPTSLVLSQIAKLSKSSKNIFLGAQNCAWEDFAAMTGEISPADLKEIGCRYVILGHSERKQYFYEDLEMISKKVQAAVRNDLIPIICVGENAEERDEGRGDVVIEQRVKKSLSTLSSIKGKPIILSYEPFWTISTSSGRIATSREVEHACRIIHQAAIDLFGPEEVKEYLKIVYGGTVNAKSIDSFLNLDVVDGFLVGSAALKIDTFRDLISQI